MADWVSPPRANSAVVMKLASRNLTTAVTVMVPNSLGPGELLLHYGTDEQKRPLSSAIGDWRGNSVLRSDRANWPAPTPPACPTKGVVCMGEFHEGRRGPGPCASAGTSAISPWRRWPQCWAWRSRPDPEGLLGDEEDLGITCALIPDRHTRR